MGWVLSPLEKFHIYENTKKKAHLNDIYRHIREPHEQHCTQQLWVRYLPAHHTATLGQVSTCTSHSNSGSGIYLHITQQLWVRYLPAHHTATLGQVATCTSHSNPGSGSYLHIT
jgi:hypothetical protein